MADPSMVVNPQITDSVTQVNTKSLAEAGAIAVSNLMQAAAQNVSTQAYLASGDQGRMQGLFQTATTQNINSLNAMGTAAATQASSIINNSDNAQTLMENRGLISLQKTLQKTTLSS